MAFITLEIDKATDLRLVKKILSQLKFVKRIVRENAADYTNDKTDVADDTVLYELLKNNFNKAYSEDEPEYSLSMLKEANPAYETR